MRRVLAVLTLALVMATIAPAVHARPGGFGAHWRNRQCRYQSVEPRRWTVGEVRATIACAVRHWPVSLDTALYIADRESGFHYYATNPYSGACGIYQHLPRYWPGRQNEVDAALPGWRLGESCYAARVNVVYSIRYAHFHGWGPWGA